MKRLSCVTLLFLAGCSQLTSYPYPECEEIVQYFNRNSNDPESLEFIWVERRSAIVNCTSTHQDDFDIYIKVRGKNSFGAKSLAHHTCTIRGGKLVNVFNFWVDQRSNSRGKAPAPPSD